MQIEECLDLIRRSQRAVVTTHLNPDGDAIGSELALARALARVGISAVIVNHDDIPSTYRFLDTDNAIRCFDPLRDRPLLDAAQIIFVLDANQPGRTGSLRDAIEASSASVVCIDHHLDPQPFADLYIVDPAAAATGEILFDLLVRLLGTPLPKDIAEPLYVAIMTDTGSFRFPNTDPLLHRRVADLLEWGADPGTLYRRVYEEGSAGRLRLLGEGLASLSVSPDGRVAAMVISRRMLEKTGTTEADTENFINYTLTISGVEIGLMFTEMPDFIKVSFRSRGDLPVNTLARQFGGNGHKNAAGARISGRSLEDTVQEVTARAMLLNRT